ncbi:MAG: CDP-diacylglycerol--glycerol-3-phosphate 3-phosphatidyltransferase [Acidobacteria bacterium]|nr:CDP-diacylglycerol--glycerol-3-phosphate 3-phosphatidyltransferase [Acidobacteriota bacterium]
MASSSGGTPRVNPMKGRVVATGDTPASAGNIANIVTVIRILLAPVFIILLLDDAGKDGYLRYIAAIVFVFAIVTDSVDGLLARQRNLVTDLGKLIDPIADKVLTGGALVGLSILGELWWWVTIVILVREVGITVFRFIALRDRVIAASWLGKVKTVAQAVAISFALFPFWNLIPAWSPGIHVFNELLMAIALVLTMVSGVEYLWQAYKVGRAKRTALPE